jgi:hypothetical protein
MPTLAVGMVEAFYSNVAVFGRVATASPALAASVPLPLPM